MIDQTPRERRPAPASLHDILGAWQAGSIPYRKALALTGMKTVTDLYEAAGNSNATVPGHAREPRHHSVGGVDP